MSCFDTAIANLAKDVHNKEVTVDQIIWTAQCLEVAYGPKAEEIVALALAEARLVRWKPPVRFH